MKYILLSLMVTFCVTLSQAALITHTDYTAGNVITAAGQNTNENAIVNEFNGNINTANLLDGGVATADLADNAVTNAKLATVVQSSFTYLNQARTYRRPNLTWQSVALVDVENNTGSGSETCLGFPDEFRCVTENTSVQTKYRRFDITAACQFTVGTEDSGLIGATEATQTWYATYGVKSTIDSTKFVICGSTVAPTQGNFSTLNGMFGTNGWVYLGTIRNGDGTTSVTNDIVKFVQDGSRMAYVNTITGLLVNGDGVMISTATGTSMTYAVSYGTGAAQTPATALMVSYRLEYDTGAGNIRIANSANTNAIQFMPSAGGSSTYTTLPFIAASEGIFTSTANTVRMNAHIHAWTDKTLGIGLNPQL